MASGLRDRLQEIRKRRGIATIGRRQGGVVVCTAFHERHVRPGASRCARPIADHCSSVSASHFAMLLAPVREPTRSFQDEIADEMEVGVGSAKRHFDTSYQLCRLQNF